MVQNIRPPKWYRWKAIACRGDENVGIDVWSDAKGQNNKWIYKRKCEDGTHNRNTYYGIGYAGIDDMRRDESHIARRILRMRVEDFKIRSRPNQK